MDTTALATIIALLLLGVDGASNNSGENPPPANERFRRLIPYMTFYITQQSLVDRQQPLFRGVPKVPQYQSNSLILSQPYAFVKNPIPSPPPTPPPSTFYYSRPDPLYSRPTQDINDQARLRALAKILGILQNARKNPQASSNSGIQALAQILSILQQAHALPAGTEPIVSEVIKHHLQPAVEVNSNGGSGLVAETPNVPTVLSTPKPFVSSTPESIEVTDNDLQNYSDEDYTAEIEKPTTLNRYAAKVPYGFKPHSYYKGPTSTQSFPDPYSEGSTPGRAGIDYPTYSVIPQTSFSCKTQRYKGFFGDPDTSCQVWHYCDLNGGQASFLCPNGTIFSQVALTCDWWFNVKCSSTSQLYVLNERLYKYILPVTPSFPEDYHGPLVDQYLTLKFQEQENKKKSKSKTTTTTTPSSKIDDN